MRRSYVRKGTYELRRIKGFPFFPMFVIFLDHPSDIHFSPHSISCTQIVSHSFLIYYISDLPLLLAIPVHIDKSFGSSILNDRIRCAPSILLKKQITERPAIERAAPHRQFQWHTPR